jgi:hypothetical protein
MKQIGAESTVFTEQKCAQNRKVPLKLYQIQDFPEIGIALGSC